MSSPMESLMKSKSKMSEDCSTAHCFPQVKTEYKASMERVIALSTLVFEE